MGKHLNIGVTDEEYAALKAVKGPMTWPEFIMTLVKLTPKAPDQEGTSGAEQPIQ